MLKSALLSTTILYFATYSAAQVINSTNDGCPGRIQRGLNATVNSTGVVSIPFDTNFVQNWSLTMTFNDSGQRSNELVRWSNPVAGYLQGYLNVPQSPFQPPGEPRSINACIYMLGGRNVSKSNNAENSCEGVFSNECIKFITDNIVASNGPRCPDFPALETLCGAARGVSSTTSPILISSNNCTVPLPQGASRGTGGDRTFAVMGVGLSLGITEQGMTDYTYYDRLVRQVVPWVVSTWSNGRSVTKMVCVAPDNVLGNSRKPQGPWPPAGASGTSPASPSSTPSGAEERIIWTSVHAILVVIVLMLNTW